jgi:polyisoprenoid-binding protein YceI
MQYQHGFYLKVVVIHALMLLVSFTCLISMSLAEEYQIIKEDSQLQFSGTHTGQPFEGEFTQWQAEIDFDFENPQESSIAVTIDPASATTGNAMYDGTLPQADWFDVANHPQATFQSRSIEPLGGNQYRLTGPLNLKGITQDVSFVVVIEQADDQKVSASGELELNRADFNIGQKSDPSGEWVSPVITVTLDITAVQE